MSISSSEPDDDIREVELTTKSNLRLKGETFRDRAGDLFVKLSGGQFAGRKELQDALSADEELTTVWVRVTDKVSKQLLEEGQSLSAWMRVKKADGRFLRKTALISLGAVAAITITRRVIQQHKSR
jgi:hypothetical protein